MDFEVRASAAKASAAHRQPDRTAGGRSWARRYAKIVRRKNSPDVTSRRSVIQATDSTRSGWMAKKSAAAVAPALTASVEAAGTASASRRRATR